jgi:hypothetical protein
MSEMRYTLYVRHGTEWWLGADHLPWLDLLGFVRIMRDSGYRDLQAVRCATARITEVEATAVEWGYRELVTKRVAPLVWLAMPGHDDGRGSL